MLLDRLRRRDPQAFGEVVARYGGPLVRTLEEIVRDRGVAEDLAQESLIRLFLNVEGVHALRAWLFHVALNLARSHLRRKRVAEAAPILGAPKCGDPDSVLRELIHGAIDDLPEGARVAFVLREVAGLTTEEAAVAAGCSEEAIRQRLVEARGKLRSILTPKLRSYQGV